MTWTLVLAVISIQWKRSFHSHVTVALKGLSRLLRMFWRKREETHLARMGALQDVDYWLLLVLFCVVHHACLLATNVPIILNTAEGIHLQKVFKPLCGAVLRPWKYFRYFLPKMPNVLSILLMMFVSLMERVEKFSTFRKYNSIIRVGKSFQLQSSPTWWLPNRQAVVARLPQPLKLVSLKVLPFLPTPNYKDVNSGRKTKT